ncbi:glutathione S-transferase 1-1-like [Periplaneta americana]|uniref:glutathione S-transferase 1-1-like n=1 Tax=Periplaneta americana TaxID=6978 RepID=UPI0037E9A05E
MPILLYNMEDSPPCLMVRLLAKTLGVKLEIKNFNYEKGEHKAPEFVEINPLHTVPTINDNGFIVNESRAILGYLVDKYAKDDSLYPKDPVKRTIINQRLYFDIGTLYQPFLDYYCQVLENGTLGHPSKLARLEEAFQVLDKYLNGQQWVAGNSLSIADYSIVSSVASIECVGFDVGRYPNVTKWYQKAQKTIPGYGEIVGHGCALLAQFYKKCKK